MKKIISALVILQTTTTLGMHFVPALVAGTTPLTIPAAYYWKKNLNNTDPAKDTWRPFVQAAVYGMVPGINIGLALILGVGGALYAAEDRLNHWAAYEEARPLFLEEKEKATAIGFLSGISLYAAIPLALKAFKKEALNAAMKPKL